MEKIAQLMPLASSLGMDDGRVSESEVVAVLAVVMIRQVIRGSRFDKFKQVGRGLVFKSPVQSGFSAQFWVTGTATDCLIW